MMKIFGNSLMDLLKELENLEWIGAMFKVTSRILGKEDYWVVQASKHPNASTPQIPREISRATWCDLLFRLGFH